MSVLPIIESMMVASLPTYTFTQIGKTFRLHPLITAYIEYDYHLNIDKELSQ